MVIGNVVYVQIMGALIRAFEEWQRPVVGDSQNYECHSEGTDYTRMLVSANESRICHNERASFRVATM